MQKSTLIFVAATIIGVIISWHHPYIGFWVILVALLGLLNFKIFIESKEIGSILFPTLTITAMCGLLTLISDSKYNDKSEISQRINKEGGYFASVEISNKRIVKIHSNTHYRLETIIYRDMYGKAGEKTIDVSQKEYNKIEPGQRLILANELKTNNEIIIWNSNPSQEDFDRLRNGLITGDKAAQFSNNIFQQEPTIREWARNNSIFTALIVLAVIGIASQLTSVIMAIVLNLAIIFTFYINYPDDMFTFTIHVGIMCFLSSRLPFTKRIMKQLAKKGGYVTKGQLSESGGSKGKSYYITIKDWNGQTKEYCQNFPQISSIAYSRKETVPVILPLGLEQTPIIIKNDIYENIFVDHYNEDDNKKKKKRKNLRDNAEMREKYTNK